MYVLEGSIRLDQLQSFPHLPSLLVCIRLLCPRHLRTIIRPQPVPHLLPPCTLILRACQPRSIGILCQVRVCMLLHLVIQ